MPIYIFKCQVCEQVTEHILGIREEHPTTCECGGELKQEFTKPAVHFKGTGFYETDYKKKR